MKKITTILALALLFISCKNEEITPEYNGERSVSLRFVENGAVTRALGNPQPEAPAQFNGGNLYLVTQGGMIMRHYVINNIAPAADPITREVTGNAIRIADITHENGVILAEVPGNVRFVYLIGNTEMPPAVIGTNIEGVRQHTLHVFSQVDVNNVNLWGRAPLIDTQTLSHNGRQLFVARDGYVTAGNQVVDGMMLRPTVARIELQEIRSLPVAQGGQITSFTVDAIFIDRYFSHARVDGTPSQLVSRETTSTATRASYFAIPPVNEYFMDNNNALHDIIDQPGNVVTSGTQRWAYNLFSSGSGSTFSQMPAIVIRLSDVVLACGTPMPSPQFITITGFRDAAFPDGRPGIQAGNVYQVSAVEFDLRHLSSYPYPRPKDVNVTVTLAHWNGVEIRPPGFRTPTLMSRSIGCVQSVADRTFNVGRAVCGDCAVPNITYQWQQSRDGVEWTSIPASNTANLTFAPLTRSYYFRRLATCDCQPNRTIGHHLIARVTVPEHLPASAFPDVWIEIGGIRWATRNLDLRQTENDPDRGLFANFAYHPADAGMSFQWGRPLGWRDEDPVNRRWNFVANEWQYAAWVGMTVTGIPWAWDDFSEDWDPCPAGWRLPTREELEVLQAATNEWIDKEPIPFLCQRGRLYRCGDNQLFLPASGWRFAGSGVHTNVNEQGIIWSSTTGHFTNRFGLRIAETGVDANRVHDYAVSNGLRVRCVKVD